ncbi:carboxypeptidase-like regulatory domain-containing protein [Terriglobus albidus]|uniref:carboxypeptidase-like regulatory domain-containing protein n=1 Tax=Terriglobus albidus TaxID=1592106 RepID=UPI0021DFDF3B|nr:carboxypeptidase-like regulatory domain-containing protein [Terriglobus albidus]
MNFFPVPPHLTTIRGSGMAGAVLILGSMGGSVAAQQSVGGQPIGGPPPPFKPVVTIRYGGAYNGPRNAPQRTITGLVKNKEGEVMSEAMVYLKDIQGKSTLVAIVDSTGSFHFGPLSLEHDYEVWAEAGELKSPKRSISTFMAQNEVSLPLLVDVPERHQGEPTLKRRPEAPASTEPRASEGAQLGRQKEQISKN